MRNLEKIFGSERWKEISKLAIEPSELTIYNSVIFKKDENNDPIYLTHTNLPSLLDDDSEIKPEFVTTEDYVMGDYCWNPIDYTDIIFTDLTPVTELGDIILITENEVFELLNVSIDEEEGRMFYDEAVLINE